MKVWSVIALILLLGGCAMTSTPVDIPLDIAVAGNVGEVNTSVTSSVQNIVSQMEWWQMGVVVALAYLVGLLSPGPMDWIRGFFSGLKEIIFGIKSLF